MAKGINKVCLLGHVGKDPEIRVTQGGMSVASFSLATADRQKDASGNYVDRTEWHNIIAFQKTVEVIRDYVKKGTQLHIEGKIQTRSWDDKESGQKKYRTEILVNDLTLLGGPGKEGGNGEKAQQPAAAATTSGSGYTNGRGAGYGRQPDYGDTGITDDDIPF